MPVRTASLALCMLFTSCRLVDAGGSSGPGPVPGHYDRPAAVRALGRTGTWLGAVPGAVLSVLAYPFTWTLTELVDEPLGMNRDEWAVAPLTGMAALGNHALGTPADALHWVFWRAWVEPEPSKGFDHVPPERPRR